MKKIFVYFDNIAMCENTEEAVAFINSLPGLTCNSHTEKLLEDLFRGKKDFHGEDIRSLATTGCGKSRIRIYDALGDTLEQHREEYTRREQQRHLRIEEDRCRMMDEKSREGKRKFNEAIRPNPGKYRISMKIWYYNKDKITGLYPTAAKEEIYKDTIYAESGMDAYNRTVKKILDEFDVVDYVTVTDSNFRFEYIGK